MVLQVYLKLPVRFIVFTSKYSGALHGRVYTDLNNIIMPYIVTVFHAGSGSMCLLNFKQETPGEVTALVTGIK